MKCENVAAAVAPAGAQLLLRASRARTAALACAAILLLALPWQMRWGTNGDTSWIITMCERVLAGERLYVDIIETNPPFTLWLYMPPVMLARFLGIGPEPMVHIYVYGLCLSGLGFAILIAWRARLPDRGALLMLLPAFLALLVLFPGNSFAEREHIGVALLLPLLVLTAWRSTRGAPTVPTALAVSAGLVGTVIVLVKPYYAVIHIATALFVSWRRRSIGPLFAPEHWAAGFVCLAYLGAVLAFHPEFISDIYPVLADTYMRVHRVEPTSLLGVVSLVLAFWLCLLFVLRPGVPMQPMVAVLAIASAAAWIPFIYQGKAWPYHGYPAVTLGLGALLCRAFATSAPGAPTTVSKLALVMLTAILIRPFMQTQLPDRALVDTIRVATEQPSVGMLGSGIETGHPLTRMIGGRWTDVYCSDWLGSMAFFLGRRERHHGNVERAIYYEDMAERYIAGKLHALDTAAPEVLLIQANDRLWIEHLEQYDAYARVMGGYRLLTGNDWVEVYLRTEPGPAAAGG